MTMHRLGRRRKFLLLLPLFILGALAFLGAFGWVVMSLWNWLVPTVFGWRTISFWQALGLLLLSRILVGGFGGGSGHRPHWRRRMTERWDQMSPEERERFVEGLKARCGGVGHTRPEPGG
jgi:MFS family permease